MARARLLSGTVGSSAQLAGVEPEAAILFMLCIPHLDSMGCMDGDPAELKRRVCPAFEYLPERDLAKRIRQLEAAVDRSGEPLVRWLRYVENRELSVDGKGADEGESVTGRGAKRTRKRYTFSADNREKLMLYFPGFDRHNRLDRPSSRLHRYLESAEPVTSKDVSRVRVRRHRRKRALRKEAERALQRSPDPYVNTPIPHDVDNSRRKWGGGDAGYSLTSFTNTPAQGAGLSTIEPGDQHDRPAQLRRIMSLVRHGTASVRPLYATGSPPPGRTEAQDTSTAIKLLEEGWSVDHICETITGLCMMRDSGALRTRRPAVEPGESASLGLLFVTGFGVRPLAAEAHDFWRLNPPDEELPI